MSQQITQAIVCLSLLAGIVSAADKEPACGMTNDERISKISQTNLDAQTTRTKIVMQSLKCRQTSVLFVRTPECKDREWCIDDCTGCKSGAFFYEITGYYTGQHNPASGQ